MKKIFILLLFVLSGTLIYAQTSSTPSENRAESIKTVFDFLKKCPCYFLATVDGDRPQARPFGSLNIYDGNLYIQTGRKKNVAKQITVNPKVCICAINGNQWIRINAELVEDNRVEAKQSMLDTMPGLKKMYSATDNNTVVYYLKNADATINGGGGNPIKIKF